MNNRDERDKRLQQLQDELSRRERLELLQKELASRQPSTVEPFMDKLKYLQRQVEPAQNIGAGMLQGVKSMGESLPNLVPMMHPKMGEMFQKISPRMNFDPYAMMGVEKSEDKFSDPWLEQQAGEASQFLLGGEGAGALVGDIARGTRKFFSPSVIAKKLKDYLGKGAETAEENIKNMTHEIRTSYDTKMNRAIEENLNPVLKEGGDLDVYEMKNPSGINAYREIPDLDLPMKDKTLEGHFVEFKSNPIVKNAQDFQSEIGEEIGRLKSVKRTKEEDNQLTALTKYRNKLIKDITNALGKKSKDLANRYTNFRNIYREEVEPYHSTKKLREITKERKTLVKDPENIFQYPADIESKEGKETVGKIKKILSDLSQTTKGRMLFNKIVKLDEPKKIVKALEDAKKTGYSEHFTPEIEELIKSLKNRMTAKNALMATGLIPGLYGLSYLPGLIGKGIGLAGGSRGNSSE